MRGHHRYRWQLAQKNYEHRMKARKHFLKFTDEMKRTVRRFIVYGQYGPEQICGRFRMKGEEMVCAETIYRWIWQEKRRGNDEMARKSLGYLTPIEYCKLMFNFDFGVRCTSK